MWFGQNCQGLIFFNLEPQVAWDGLLALDVKKWAHAWYALVTHDDFNEEHENVYTFDVGFESGDFSQVNMQIWFQPYTDLI